MAAGRPTKYKEEFIKKVDEYLATCHFEIGEFHKTRGEKSDTYERVANINLPKIEGFSQFIDIAIPTLLEWEKLYPPFSNALDKIRREQHNILVDGGVAGMLNPTIVKLMLSSNHGYREKMDTDVTSGGDKLQIVLANEIVERKNETA